MAQVGHSHTGLLMDMSCQPNEFQLGTSGLGGDVISPDAAAVIGSRTTSDLGLGSLDPGKKISSLGKLSVALRGSPPNNLLSRHRAPWSPQTSLEQAISRCVCIPLPRPHLPKSNESPRQNGQPLNLDPTQPQDTLHGPTTRPARLHVDIPHPLLLSWPSLPSPVQDRVRTLLARVLLPYPSATF